MSAKGSLHYTLYVAVKWKDVKNCIILLLQKQWSKTKCQCNCMHKLKQNVLFFCPFWENAKKYLLLYELYEYEYDYCILEMSNKGRQEKCQKRGIEAVTDSHWHWVQEHLFSSNLNWMLDFGVGDENNSLISLLAVKYDLPHPD